MSIVRQEESLRILGSLAEMDNSKLKKNIFTSTSSCMYSPKALHNLETSFTHSAQLGPRLKRLHGESPITLFSTDRKTKICMIWMSSLSRIKSFTAQGSETYYSSERLVASQALVHARSFCIWIVVECLAFNFPELRLLSRSTIAALH